MKMPLRMNLHSSTVKMNMCEALMVVQLEGHLLRVHPKSFQTDIMVKIMKLIQKRIGKWFDCLLFHFFCKLLLTSQCILFCDTVKLIEKKFY